MSFQERKVIRDRIEADRDRIWRSAALDYQSGERPFLAAEDQEASNQRNKSFELENPFEAIVGHGLCFGNGGDQSHDSDFGPQFGPQKVSTKKRRAQLSLKPIALTDAP